MARWANFFAVGYEGARCRANFFAEMPVEAPCWASFLAGEADGTLCQAKFFAVGHEGARCRANFFAGQQSRGPAGRVWRLDGGCVPPLDLGRATDTRSRVHLPSWLPVGASGRRPAIAFPQDSSHFAENATHPYI